MKILKKKYFLAKLLSILGKNSQKNLRTILICICKPWKTLDVIIFPVHKFFPLLLGIGDDYVNNFSSTYITVVSLAQICTRQIRSPSMVTKRTCGNFQGDFSPEDTRNSVFSMLELPLYVCTISASCDLLFRSSMYTLCGHAVAKVSASRSQGFSGIIFTYMGLNLSRKIDDVIALLPAH